jgi:pimeloyl-ACP methyl ester carboxylesterase
MTRGGARREPGLRRAIDAVWREVDSPRCGRIGYYVDETGGGPPLVLVHSLNAAPSAVEMKPIFDRFRGERPVFALDLPGFGRSERGDRDYTPELLADAVDELTGSAVKGRADVVALSLGAEIAARAIVAAPERYSSLCLISPTGFSRRTPPGPGVVDGIERVLGISFVADPIFRALTSKASIRFFLARNFVGPPAREMIDYAITSAAQPGARFAPFRFLSGRLFTRDALESLYDRLRLPVLVLYDEDPNVSFDRLEDWLRRGPGRSAERISPTLGLPHWERLEACVEALERFWGTVTRESCADLDR